MGGKSIEPVDINDLVINNDYYIEMYVPAGLKSFTSGKSIGTYLGKGENNEDGEETLSFLIQQLPNATKSSGFYIEDENGEINSSGNVNIAISNALNSMKFYNKYSDEELRLRGLQKQALEKTFDTATDRDTTPFSKGWLGGRRKRKTYKKKKQSKKSRKNNKK